MVSSLSNATPDERGLGYGIVKPSAVRQRRAVGNFILEFNSKLLYSGECLRWLVSRTEANKPVESPGP